MNDQNTIPNNFPPQNPMTGYNQGMPSMPQQMPAGMPPMSPEQYMAWYNQMMQWQQQSGMPAGTVPAQMPMQGGAPVAQQPQYAVPQQPPIAPMAQPIQPMQQQVQPTPLQQQVAPMQPSQPAVNPVGSQPMMVDGQLNQALMQRDPNVLNFMAQAVREKFKDQQVTDEFVNNEAARLYDEFGEKLVEHFEPMLDKAQIEQFDGLLQSGSSQDQLLEFLMGCIPDLTSKIEQVLLSYKDKYLLQ